MLQVVVVVVQVLQVPVLQVVVVQALGWGRAGTAIHDNTIAADAILP